MIEILFILIAFAVIFFSGYIIGRMYEMKSGMWKKAYLEDMKKIEGMMFEVFGTKFSNNKDKLLPKDNN